mmetsp:Transcript_1254/g.5064  ORF Transcript_1254/g.5064 Transcript_1254/m.5064 type:complete len:219 (-) Transcript_1254:540-1196(-)
MIRMIRMIRIARQPSTSPVDRSWRRADVQRRPRRERLRHVHPDLLVVGPEIARSDGRRGTPAAAADAERASSVRGNRAGVDDPRVRVRRPGRPSRDAGRAPERRLLRGYSPRRRLAPGGRRAGRSRTFSKRGVGIGAGGGGGGGFGFVGGGGRRIDSRRGRLGVRSAADRVADRVVVVDVADVAERERAGERAPGPRRLLRFLLLALPPRDRAPVGEG